MLKIFFCFIIKGYCYQHIVEHGEMYGTVWASWIVEGKAKRTDQKISGSISYPEDEMKKKITWDLHK